MVGDLQFKRGEALVGAQFGMNCAATGAIEQSGFCDHRRENFRMAMALVDCRISRKAIEIAPAFDIPYICAFAAGEDNVQRLIVLRAEPDFGCDQIGGLAMRFES